MQVVLRITAIVGALAHVYFFYKEAIKWDVLFVEMVAPSWVRRLGGKEEAKPCVKWAADLAINVGAYNLVLAVGLSWVGIAGKDVAGTLGIFLSVWLLGAAAAAYYTEVKPAFYIQGTLGVV